MEQQIIRTPGNTPVSDIPSDYYPPGNGFWFVLQHGIDTGKKLYFRDSLHGKGKPGDTIVFVHGNPESSYIYRKIIGRVVGSARKPVRIVSMDHIGFGLSDQASYEMTSMDHSENLLQLIQHLDLKNVTLVIHDWGGPIGIGAFLREPERVKNLVVLNTTVFPMPGTGYTYRNYPISWLGWARTPSLVPNMFWGEFASYSIFRTPAKPFAILSQLIKYMATSKIGMNGGNESTAKKLYRDQFKSKFNVKSSKRMVRQSAVWGHGNRYREPGLGERDTSDFYGFIQSSIRKLWGPEGQNIGVRAVLGRWDPLGKDEVIAQWTENLPQLEGHVKIFKDVGHFIEEFRPAEISETILEVAGLQ